MLRSDPFVGREQESQPRPNQELTAPEEAEMARITRLELDPITIDTANATVDVHLDVSFSRSDKDANTPYKVECTLLGDDPGGEFGEDNTDDVIPNGTLTLAGQTIRADGLDVQTFDFSKTLAKEKLNEDLIGSANPDEIKAHVLLTPVVAHPTEADSNIRRLSIT